MLPLRALIVWANQAHELIMDTHSKKQRICLIRIILFLKRNQLILSLRSNFAFDSVPPRAPEHGKATTSLAAAIISTAATAELLGTGGAERD